MLPSCLVAVKWPLEVENGDTTLKSGRSTLETAWECGKSAKRIIERMRIRLRRLRDRGWVREDSTLIISREANTRCVVDSSFILTSVH